MKIRQLKTQMIVIYPQESFPISTVVSETFASAVQRQFKMSPAQPYQQVPGLTTIAFAGGTYTSKKTSFSIEKIELNQRSMMVSVWADSDIAEAIFRSVLDLGSVNDAEWRTSAKQEPLLKYFESSCFAKLEIDLNKILSNDLFNQVADDLRKEVPGYGATATLEPFGFKFQIRYRNLPESLLSSGVSLVDKYFTLERRENTESAANLYFSVCPSDTKTHLSILEWIESRAS